MTPTPGRRPRRFIYAAGTLPDKADYASARDVIVGGNLIEDVGVHGVWLQGPSVGSPPSIRGIRVPNNRIRRGGQPHGSGSGIYISHCGDSQIFHNSISNMPRAGIFVISQKYGGMAAAYNGVAVTPDKNLFYDKRKRYVKGGSAHPGIVLEKGQNSEHPLRPGMSDVLTLFTK